MTSPNELTTSFIPKSTIARTFGKTTVYVYPEVNKDMTHAEKSYGFMITKSALEAAKIPYAQMLQILAGSTRTAPLVSVLQARFVQAAKTLIRQENNFELLSYHGRNGRMMTNATDANGVLRPTENMTNATRRPEGIMYAKLACDLRFSALDPGNISASPFTFFVRLPTETRTVQNSTGNDLLLNTFHEVSTWDTTTDQIALNAIWDHPRSYGKPFTLKPPTISLDVYADAILEDCSKTLEGIALEASWATIVTKVYAQLCPNIIEDPASVIQNIHQVSVDSKGTTVIQTVEQYFNAIQQMTEFFPKDNNWEMDVPQHFITHLRDNIRQEMLADRFVYVSSTSNKDAYSQLMNLQRAFAAATVAEESILRVHQIAKDAVSAHSFSAQINASMADDTIGRYSSVKCWGCGQLGHGYANKAGDIICPEKDKPGVKEAADKARKDFNDRLKKKKADGKRKKDTNSLLTTALSALSGDEIKALIAGSPSKKRKTDHITTFVIDIFEVNSSKNQKPLLPISIEANLPHIALPIGQDLESASVSILVAYDTCAACNVGYLGHHLPIAEKFPQIVKSLIYCEDKYSPLVLSGIVTDPAGKATVKPTASLPAVIEYWLPFRTKEGHRTTLKIALGHHVSVNTIIGMPMIKPAKLSLDLTDNVVEAGVLDAEPFPVLYRPTIRSAPDFSKVDSEDTKLLISNSTLDHITVEEVIACRVALAMPTQINHENNAVTPTIDSSGAVLAALEDIKTDADKSPLAPITVPKNKWRPKTPSVWETDEMQHDPDFDYIFQDRTGYSLRKARPHVFPPPDPAFHCLYDDVKDRNELARNLILEENVSADVKHRIISFVKEFWDVFREAGVKIPIRGYEMIIDTGKHKPIAVRNIHYGLHESPIMQKTIDSLLDLGFIKPDTTSSWGFRITLAPKPHQENVTDINTYVWRFCINYIRLNMITKPAEYPIPRCDDAVMYGFGNARYFILFDAYSGYHQVYLSASSSAKTAFFAPHGRKYVWVVMPFGLRNCPVVFIAMMHDLKDLWTAMCIKANIEIKDDNGTTIIMDDTLAFAATMDTAFIVIRCVCLIARKYHLTWKLKKAQWFPSAVEFVGVDMRKDGGNTPAKSKDPILNNWKKPTTPREVMAFIGFAIFYLRWCPWFELKIKPLRVLMLGKTIDHIFTADEFDSTAVDIFNSIRQHILSKPILQRANINKRFYLKTDFSSLGLGFALCQPDDSAESLAAMKREDAGGPCEFEFCVSKRRLLPVAFGSRKTIGNEIHFHSHPGESLAATWAIIKNRHFLWGRPFSLMTDCQALLWLMNYKGTNHAIRRLQMELLGYWFDIVNRPGKMLVDADFFSRLGIDIHIDPLLKDYLSFARQAYVDNPPPTDTLSDQNMPGRRSKRTKFEVEDESAPSVNLAFVEWLEDTIDITPPSSKFARKLCNVPLHIISTKSVQSPSSKHFSYITDTAVQLSRFNWCLSQPGHGHFIEASRAINIHFDPTIVCDTSQSCRNTMQTRYKSSFVFESLTLMQDHCAKHALPLIQGYYANCHVSNQTTQNNPDLTSHEIIISTLQTKADLQIFVVELPVTLSVKQYSDFKRKLEHNGWTLFEQKVNTSEHYSDKICSEFDIIIGLSQNYFPSVPSSAWDYLSPTPPVPNGMSPNILVEFNTAQYALQYVGEIFTVNPKSVLSARNPTVEYLISLKDVSLPSTVDNGYKVFNKDSPAPLPSTTTTGLFGSLFGISFPNLEYTAENEEKKECIRAIAIAEYTSFFGFDPNYSAFLNGQPDVVLALGRTLPCRTASRIAETTNFLLQSSMEQRRQIASESSGIDLSIPALFNGIIADQLPDESAWKLAYNNDASCAQIISLVTGPAKITTETLSLIHSVYRSAVRNSEIKWENNRLNMYEPVANSTNMVRLTLVPQELRRHIFTAFHVNPLGGHFSTYYTLHRIRLRFHWPSMYTYIKTHIDNCVACLLRNGGARASSELLYSFPIAAPMVTVTADAWVAGKTTAFDGNIGLMIVLCNMTGFTAIEPIKAMNSSSFARSVYVILLRYGLSHCVITDPDSKFKGEFKKAFTTLNINHHMTARGNHNAVLVERFNRFLNSGLRVFNNDRNSNRVFIEGAQTLTYSWNSCPVLGTDLSRSLLVVGREFHFPIDFAANRQISYVESSNDAKLFADNLTDLLLKSREIYSILITEHRAAHRELRNSQINKPRQFKLGDIVFTNVQVQSKKSTGTVQKLAYIKRGPYEIIKDYTSGSYELKPLIGNARATIKKHGSDLYLSPRSLIPYKQTESSDTQFSNLNKKTLSEPYRLIGLEGFEPAQPWSAPAAAAQLNLANIQHVPKFPSVKEMDNEFDGWPESGNPFIIREHSLPVAAPPKDNIQTLPSHVRTRATIIADLVASEDKLFFIAFTPYRTQERKEWKLVRVDFQLSMRQHPSCLQDGRFLVEFFIEHHRDHNLDISSRRYWLEYHRSNTHKTLSTDYHILQPSQYSRQIAKSKQLVPYREWVNLDDPQVSLHGPFDFATRNNRKTKDRISASDWLALADCSDYYQNQAPVISQHVISVDLAQPIYERVNSNVEVRDRCNNFMFHLEYQDKTLRDYGGLDLP